MVNKGKVPSGSYGKRPRCDNCKESMQNIYIRNGSYRYFNIGYFCSTCNYAYLNNEIKAISLPVFIGLKKVIE
jgi:hypothetical protein